MPGCRTSVEKEEVLHVLQVRGQALNERDLPLYLSIISPGYRDKDKDFAALAAGVEESFKKRGSVAYQAGHRTVTISGKQAEVTGTYRMKVMVEGREVVLDGKEHITLSREGETWKIIAGL